MTNLHLKTSINRSLSRLALLLILLVVVCFAPFQRAQGVAPPPDGGYPNFTTAEGTQALQSLTTGAGNTGVGWRALFADTTGSFNTGLGAGALVLNQADSNTAVGAVALLLNTTGQQNTAVGTAALLNNTVGERNTAMGFQALANGTGNLNFANTAIGYSALFNNTIGQSNTATGASALFNNIDGDSNTAVGVGALGANISGSSNIGIGSGAGQNLTTGDRNIDIGNTGMAGESNKIRIGNQGTQDGTFIAGISGTTVTGVAVLVSNNGQLGVGASSQRFKDEIRAMDSASEAILGLKPVTFRYKKEIDPAAMPQFGLVAEEVAKINPDLVIRDADGKPFTVRYDAVNAMLLNEFLKEHRKVEEQETAISRLNATVARQAATDADQQTEIQALAATVKEQASQIQKVSAQLEASKPATQVVVDNQ